ncbi:N(1)-aminopropylagmatine ureohydrolase [wastewater metagenome]|uniref:N(1)-aminopropylagmatine ureohydrolase n=2 Tax=unclassified sequences TaxID=12908 RepID=A0A5B8RDS0_9ZZZZ|nr:MULTISPECIES: agmatinase [Arhodomonas]QEA05592.1 N(1)-aminopropylagmatine ureohydrolase [uncultured organism]
MSNLRYQLLPNRPVDTADILVLPVPHEQTVSYKPGTRNGPEAILDATAQLEYFEEDGNWSPLMHMGICVVPPLGKQLYERAVDYHRRLARSAAALPDGPLILALGGEHSITPALVQARMPEPGTVVCLDAHADLRRHFEGTELSHACPMHHIRAAGHGVLLAGVRSLMDEEAARVRDDDAIECHRDRALHRPAAWQALLERLAGLDGPVWLTVDMDVFSPAEVPGVGTPQPGGLGWYDVVELVETLIANPRIDLRGCDIVELVPEPSCVSEMVAAKLSQRMISCWGRRQGFHEAPATGSQSEVSYD